MVDVIALERRVLEALTKRCGAGPDTTILALVSGGADSVALMHLLHRVHPGPLVVCSFDHGLRRESVGEVDAVRAQAAGLNLGFRTRRLSIEAGTGLQERARNARYLAAEDVASEVGAELIATGHTASDQAETILFRLARGTGRAGALGMAPRRGSLIRPLLGLTRGDTCRYCAALGLTWFDDPSNADERFTRSRVRHGVLADLARVHPGAERNLAAFADRLRDEDTLIVELVAQAAERCGDAGGLHVADLALEPPAIRRLLVRGLIERAGLATASASTIDRVLAILPGAAPIQIEGGLAAVDRDRLVIEPSSGLPPSESVPLSVPGSATFGAVRLDARRGAARASTPTSVSIDHPGPFLVRSPLPGDRLEMADGWHKRVGHLLAEAGVPARNRCQVPVVAIEGVAVWVAGHRAATAMLATGGRAASNVNLQSFG